MDQADRPDAIDEAGATVRRRRRLGLPWAPRRSAIGSPRPGRNLTIRRLGAAILVAALAVNLALGALAFQPQPVFAATAVPKVVLIVGPVGDLTSTFRRYANEAADVAERAGAEVVKVYSPNATWRAVKRAATGASILVYLGHGNGWPSRYRDELFPPTQNGFGLNPVAGADDSTHQYFGEASVEDLRLAPNAVVLLHHLCYASGNTEPGLAEGSRDDSIQRVDNYAAGFLRAGARAVVAEGHLGPAYYVRALLRTDLTIEQIWNRSPTAHGHTFEVASVRTPGYTARMDPDRKDGGFYRSLVSAGVTAAALRSTAVGRSGSTAPTSRDEPSLVSLGLRFGTPSLGSLPVSDTTTQLVLPLSKKAAKAVPKGIGVSVRWDPIIVDPVPPVGSSAPEASPDPQASPDPGESPPADGTPSPDPETGPELPESAPEVDLVVPEQLGSVVSPVRATATSGALTVDLRYPKDPGLYRLVPLLHAPSGNAYDEETQKLLTPMMVRVGGPVTAAFGVPPYVTIPAASAARIPIRVVNAGSESWDQETVVRPVLGAEELLIWLASSRAPARLVGVWVSTSGAGVELPEPATAALQPATSAPGGSGSVILEVTAPATPGPYLLLLDVVSPSYGPLSALGSAPGLIRVSVMVEPATGSDPAVVPAPAVASEPPVEAATSLP